MKRAITILLALVMVLSLAACGGGSAPTNTPAPTEAPTPEPPLEPTVEPTPEPTSEPTSEPTPTEEPHSNEFRLEAFELTGGGKYFTFKIRNLTNEKVDSVLITFQFLDENGDSLGKAYGRVENLEPGQACTSVSHSHGIKLDIHSVASMKFYEYMVMGRDRGGLFTGIFEPAVIINMEEAVIQKDTYTFSLDNSKLEKDAFYGTWELKEVETKSGPLTVSELEESKMFSYSDWILIISETGKAYLQTNNTSVKNDYQISGSGIKVGNIKLDIEDERLTCNVDEQQFFFEKISDSQSFPNLEKKEIVEMLQGTWNLDSSTRSGSFTFSDSAAQAIINDVIFDADILSILTKEKRIVISSISSGFNISMDLYYSYENDNLLLAYSGDELTRQ